MDFHINQTPDKAIIVFDVNKIMGTEAAGVHESILDLIDNGCKLIAIDLCKVTFITSYGLGILMYAYTICTKRDVGFYITGLNERLQEIIQKVNFHKIIDIK